MNCADKNPDYKKIYRIASGMFQKTKYFSHGPLDESFFTLRVYETTKDIISMQKSKIDSKSLLVAAILHDIGKIKLDEKILKNKKKFEERFKEEWKKHPKLGIPLAKKILNDLGHSEDFIKKVCFLIENHSNHECKKTMELKILQDADKLADYGYESVIRSFMHSGMFNEGGAISAIKYLQKNPIKERYNQLNLEVSRKIGRRKIKIHNSLVKELSKSIKSNLLD